MSRRRRTRTAALAEAQACLGFALRKAARGVTRLYDAELRATGMRNTQFNLLVMLDATGPVNTTTLCDQLALERTTLTRNLRPMVRKGWVRVAVGDDRRTRRVSITPRGRAAARRALPAWRRAQRAMLRRFAAHGLQGIAGPLHRLTGELSTRRR